MGPLLLAVLLAAGTRLDASVESGARLGSMTDPAARGDVELVPRLTALFAEPGAEVQAWYAPRLFLRDSAAVHHDALFAGTWQQSRNLRWLVSERFGYGRNEYTWDPGATRPFDALDTIPPVIHDFLTTDTELGFSYLPARNYALYGSLGYVAYGGVSTLSRQTLPLEQGPQLFLGLDHDLTRNDRLSTELYGSQSFVSGGRRNSLLKVTESWQRQLAADSRARLSAGLSAYRKILPGDGTLAGFYPVGAASLEQDLPERAQRLELRALAQIGPHQSRLTGDLLPRAELGASARWVLEEKKFFFRGRAAAAKELGGSRLALGALDAAIRFRPDLSLSAGAEAIWQEVGAPGLSFHWMAFTALTFSAQDIL